MAENSLAKFEGYFKMSIIIIGCKLFTRITGNTQHLLYPLLPLNASITTPSLFVIAVTVVHPFLDTKTLLRECCIVMLFIDNFILPLVIHCFFVCYFIINTYCK